MLNFVKYANTDAVTIKLLKVLGQGVNPQDVINELEKHPDYPNLLSISDILSWFKIENGAYNVAADDLLDVPTPFIANTNRGNDFTLVHKITSEYVIVSDDVRNNSKLEIDEFKGLYKGTILIVENPDLSVNMIMRSLPNTLSRYKIPVATLGLLIVFVLSVVYNNSYTANLSWQAVLLTIFKTAGVITSILLLIQSINKNNPLVQTLCGGGGKTNCNAILTSEAANVFKGLSWSEVGFFYFTGTWLLLLFGGGSASIMQLLALFNFVSLPYTFYSINYQARVVKQWCIFCTVVQALLWLEFIPLFSNIFKHGFSSLSQQQFIIAFICMFLPIAAWLIVKPLLINQQQLKTIKYRLRKLKYNRELFEASLKKQPKFSIPEEQWSIVLGNREAKNTITMASHLFCRPCARTHELIDKWFAYSSDLQVRIVFTSKNKDGDIQMPVVRHLMALNEFADKSIIKRALHDWYEYEPSNYKEWAKSYPIELSSNDSQIYKQQEWCEMADIKATPTVLINGYRLPNSYHLQDIKYMLG